MRQQVIDIYLAHQDKSKIFIVNNMAMKGIKRKYTYRVLQDIDINGVMKTKKNRGPQFTRLDKNQKRKLRTLTDGKVAPSLRSLRSKMGLGIPIIKRALAEVGIKFKKRTQVPKVSPAQADRQRDRLKKALARGTGALRPGRLIVMDDESYFHLSRHATSSGYYEGLRDVSEAVKHKRVEKFTPKLMVWAAMSARGISYFAIFEENTVMNTELYINFITCYLDPFIKSHHSDCKYIFWPDLAPCHYASATLVKLDELGIKYVSKDQNPPAAPQVHPVEKFWAHLKAKVYKDGWEAANLTELQNKIQRKLATFDALYFERLFKNLPEKLKQGNENGLASLN